MLQRVLIIGGSGRLGKPVAEHLYKEGFNVRVMTRDLDKTKALFDNNLEVVKGNVRDINSLEQALTGCQGVHISVMAEDDLIAVQSILSLLPKVSLERLTYISGSTVFEENRWFPMIEQKLIAEESIRNAEVPYTIFCPTWPMEMIPNFIQNGRASVIGKQPAPIHWFAVDELGRMVSKAYQTDQAIGKRFFIHGPEGIPMKEALERYCRVFHPEIKKVQNTPIWLIKTMGFITRDKMLRFIGNLMAYFDKVGEMGDPTEANSILGAPTLTLDEWIKRKTTVE